MAAMDTFTHFNENLPEEIKKEVRKEIENNMTELLAARSEDARQRIVRDYIQMIHSLIHHK